MRGHRTWPASAESFETHRDEDEAWATDGWAPSSSSWSASSGGRFNSSFQDQQRWSSWWYGEQRGSRGCNSWSFGQHRSSGCGGSQAEQQRASWGVGQYVKASRPRHRLQSGSANWPRSGSRPWGSWFGWSFDSSEARHQRWRPWGRHLHEVWSWNFETEFSELLAAVEEGAPAILAMDTEFPGFLCQDSQFAFKSERYVALRENVDYMTPIQLGFAVANKDGSPLGSWTFNLSFDLSTNLHTQESVKFLAEAGVDFPRHAVEGIDPSMLAWRLSNSPLLGAHSGSPQWVTFAGWYDWGYLIKLLTGRPLPSDVVSFDELLASCCPVRHELRDSLPRGSLDSLLTLYSLERLGPSHTAGSDAMATLELFFRVFASLQGQAGDSTAFPEFVKLAGQEPDFWKVEQFLDGRPRAAAAVGIKPRSLSGGSSASTSALSFARSTAAGSVGKTASDQASSSSSGSDSSCVSSSGSGVPPGSNCAPATSGTTAGGEEDSNAAAQQIEGVAEQGLRGLRGRAGGGQRLRKEPVASPRKPEDDLMSLLLSWHQEMSEFLSEVVVEAFASVGGKSLAMALFLLFVSVFVCCVLFF